MATLLAGFTALAAMLLSLVGWTVFEFDRALFLYAQALIASATLTVYRMTIWIHRPATMAVYSKAWTTWKQSPRKMNLLRRLASRIAGYFVLNRFVIRRGWNRWATHWPIMIGCFMAMAIVVPLVFGWVWFESAPDDLGAYRVMNFGVHITTIPVDGTIAFLAFHGLVWAAFPVVAGCSVGLWRRFRDRGDQAVQTFFNDIAPLLILLSIAVTGLLLTISYSFFAGALHAPLARVHMVIVSATLIWLPYSKLLHIPQRTLKLAHMVCEIGWQDTATSDCERCHRPFASVQQVEELIAVQRRLGYRFELPESMGHFQNVCPQCRRASLILTQGARWQGNNYSLTDG